MAAVHLQPDDVAAWLSTMSSAVPSQVLTNLKQDVALRRIHGLRFSEILNDCRTEDLRVEHLSPLHMARLRKAWNADFPETVDLRRHSAPSVPALGQLQDPVPPVPQGRESVGAAQRQVAWEEAPRLRFDSPQPPSPPQQPNNQGGGSHVEAPHAVFAALVIIVVDRLTCWAGLDMYTALSELRDVLPPPVWEELSTVFLKHPPQAHIVDLLCNKARNMLAGEVALWQDNGVAARQPVERLGGHRSQEISWQPPQPSPPASGSTWQRPEVSQSPAPYEHQRRRFDFPVDTPQVVPNQRYQQTDESWQESLTDTSSKRMSATCEIGRRPAQQPTVEPAWPDSLADSLPPSMASRRAQGEGMSVASTNGRYSQESAADNMPIPVNNRRAPLEGRDAPNGFNADSPLPQGVASRQSAPAPRQPAPKAGAGHRASSRDAPPSSKRSSSRGPAMVAAWVRTLPSSQVPEKEREALACAVEAEGIDGEKFTKVAQAPPMLATRGVPSPQHALKVRKAWEQVLREDACRQIALESASASKVTQKAVKMVF